MKVKVIGKNVSVTKALKDYATKKVSKLEKYIIVPEETSARVLVRTYRKEQKAEVTIPTKIGILRAESHCDDAYAAIDLAVDKLADQIRRQKTRIQKRSKDSMTEALLAEKSEEQDINIKTKTINVKMMTADEAIMEMELSDHDFYAYIDEETEEIAIVYRQKGDRGYGLLECRK